MGLCSSIFLPQARIHILGTLMVVFPLLIFGTTFYAGVRLWKYDPKGLKLARMIFAAQIPIINTPSFNYEFYTGAALKLFWGPMGYPFHIKFGGIANFFWTFSSFDADPLYFNFFLSSYDVYGINLFALFAWISLLMMTPEKKSNPPLKKTPSPAASFAKEFIFNCPNCGRPYTLEEYQKNVDTIRCVHCNAEYSRLQINMKNLPRKMPYY